MSDTYIESAVAYLTHLDEEERIAAYSRLTQEEFRKHVLSPEFAIAVDATIPGGGVATVAGPVICPHGKIEVYCSECDLKARVVLHDAIAMAVMEERIAERERCAKIADSFDIQPNPFSGGDVADRIRSGEMPL